MFIQLIDVVKGLMYMHELHVVHGGLKGVGNCLMRPVANDTIVPTGQYLRKSGWSRMSRRLWTVYGRRCGYTPRSLRPEPLGCEPRDDNHFLRRTCLVDEPRTSGLELQTNQGVGCLRPGDGYLRGPYIRIHVTVTMGSRSGTEAGFMWHPSLSRCQYVQGCHRGLERDTSRKTRGRSESWIHW